MGPLIGTETTTTNDPDCGREVQNSLEMNPNAAVVDLPRQSGEFP